GRQHDVVDADVVRAGFTVRLVDDPAEPEAIEGWEGEVAAVHGGDLFVVDPECDVVAAVGAVHLPLDALPLPRDGLGVALLPVGPVSRGGAVGAGGPALELAADGTDLLAAARARGLEDHPVVAAGDRELGDAHEHAPEEAVIRRREVEEHARLRAVAAACLHLQDLAATGFCDDADGALGLERTAGGDRAERQLLEVFAEQSCTAATDGTGIAARSSLAHAA